MWDIEIFPDRLSGKIKKITPSSERKYKTILYKGKSGKCQVDMEFDKQPWILSYYPRVLIKKVEEEKSSVKKSNTTSWKYIRDNFQFLLTIPESKIYRVVRRKEIVYELEERIIR